METTGSQDGGEAPVLGGGRGLPAPGPVRRIVRRLAASVLLALVAFPAIAATDLLTLRFALVDDAAPGEGAVALSLLLTLLAAGVLALLQAPLMAVGHALLRAAGPGRAFRSVAAGLVAVPILGAAWAILAPGLDRITEPALRVLLQVAFVVFVAAGAVVTGVVTASVIEPRLRRPGQERSAALWAGALAVVVSGAFVVLLWSRFAKGLTSAVPLAALVLMSLCEAGILLAWSALPFLRRAADRILSRGAILAMLLLVPVLALGAAEALSRLDTEAAPWVAARNGVGGRVVTALRRVWDFDEDGASPILGGGDCDDRDPFMFPTAVDEPDDGIDDDCNGEDAKAGQASVLSTYTQDPASGKRYNLVFVCIDALRADRVSFLGYGRRTTPNLDQIAKDAWVFETVVATSSTTRESIPPLFTGRFPSGIAWESEAKIRPLASSQRLLAEVLKGRGWQTFGVVDEWLQRFLPSSLRGFDIAEVPYGMGKWKQSGQQAGPYIAFRAIELLAARDPERPFFLYTHFEAPHYPYATHEDVPSFGSQPTDIYDQEVAYADRWVGLLLSYLDIHHLLKDTIVVVFGDHGEEFNEHGGTQHSRALHAESVMVPLLIKIPDRPAARVKTRVSLVDVFPTLMDVLGLRPDEPQPQGFSLFQYLAGPDPWPERPIYSELMVNNEGPLKYRKAIYKGRYKLMWDMTSGATALYDVQQDPRERAPITNPSVHDALLQELKDFVARGDHHD